MIGVHYINQSAVCALVYLILQYIEYGMDFTWKLFWQSCFCWTFSDEEKFVSLGTSLILCRANSLRFHFDFFLPLSLHSQFLPRKKKNCCEKKGWKKESQIWRRRKKVCMFLLIWWVVRQKIHHSLLSFTFSSIFTYHCCFFARNLTVKLHSGSKINWNPRQKLLFLGKRGGSLYTLL